MKTAPWARLAATLLIASATSSCDSWSPAPPSDGSQSPPLHGTLALTIEEASYPGIFDENWDIFVYRARDGELLLSERVGREREQDTGEITRLYQCSAAPEERDLRVEIHFVAAYDHIAGYFQPNAKPGDPPASDALPLAAPAASSFDVTCTPREAVNLRVHNPDPLPWLPKGHLAERVSVRAPRGARDGLWDLFVFREGATGPSLWSRRIGAALDVDGGGGAIDERPYCDARPEVQPQQVTLHLVSLFPAPLTSLPVLDWFDEVGETSIPDELRFAVRDPGPITTQADCEQNLTTPVAQRVALFADSDEGGIRFAELECEAELACPTDGEGGGEGADLELVWRCAGPEGAEPPTLYLDDLLFDCPGSDPAPLDPSAVGGWQIEEREGRAWRSWRIPVAVPPSRRCTLRTEATAEAAGEVGEWIEGGELRTPAVAASTSVYPMVSWEIPLDEACSPRHLGDEGLEARYGVAQPGAPLSFGHHTD